MLCCCPDGCKVANGQNLSRSYCPREYAISCGCLVLIKIWKVFVYSLSGYKARVIQAYYEHPNFIVRKTDHVLFGGKSVPSLKLMLRWMINIPNIPQEYAKVPNRLTTYFNPDVLVAFSQGIWRIITNSRMSQRLRYCFGMVFTRRRTARSRSQNIHIT